MADNKIANAIKFLKGEEKSLPATKTEGQVYFAYKNVGTAEKPSYTGAIYIDTPIGGTQNRIKMTANADIADKAFNDSAGLSIRDTYLSSLGYTDDGKQTILIKGSGNNQTRIALPIASTTKSGIVTTDAQSFNGTKTFTTINSTNLTVTGSNGFNYSGIGTGTADVARPVWFADNSGNGKPVINTNFTYNPATQTLSVANLSGTADKATKDSAGNDIRNTYISNITVNGTTLTFTKGGGATSSITLQDTNNAVTQTAIKSSDYTNWRTVLCGASNSATEGFTPTTVTDCAFTSDTLIFQPSSGTLKAKIFKGSLSGNASTATSATKATYDSSGTKDIRSYVSDVTISGRTITVTKGSGAQVTLTTQDTDTWRGIQNNLTSDSTTDSLSAAQGKYLKSLIDGKSNNGHNHDDRYYTEAEINSKLANYLPFSGGTMTGALNFANSIWNVVGDDVAIGDMDIAGTLGVMGKNGMTSIKLVQYDASITKGPSALGVAWTCTGNGTSTISGILSGTFSGNLSGNANTATALTSSAGSSTQPIYFSGGKPVVCTYTLNKSVPVDAKFTDTNTWRPLGTTGNTACAGNDSRLSNARPASDVYAWAKASTKPTYSWGEITGKPSTFNPSSHTHDYFPKSGVSVPNDNLNTCYTAGIYGYGPTSTGAPNSTYGHILVTVSSGNTHNNQNNWINQLAFATDGYIYHREKVNDSDWRDWTKVIDSSNIGSQSVNYANSAGSVAWGNISGKPSTFNPSSHTHDYFPLSGGTLSGALTAPSITALNYCKTPIILGDDNIDTYYHRIDCGHTSVDHFDFYEYGGIYNFYQNQSTGKNNAVLLGKITSNGWEGNVTGNLSGNAATATALTTSAGSSIQPVYFSGGKPVVCTYTLSKSVPADAKFTDTDTWRPLGTTADTACAGNDSRLSNARPASDVYAWAKAANKPSYTKSEVGLGNVDNTADSQKSVKYATSANSASTINSATPTLSTGIEQNAITVKTNDNGIFTIETKTDNASIRSALDFKWYNTNWQIGNIRGGSTNSLGFGFAFKSSSDGTLSLKSYIDTDGVYHGDIIGSATTTTKLQTYKQGSTTETYGTQYPLYAQWEDGSNLRLKVDNYTVKVNYADKAGSASSATNAATAAKLQTARTITLAGSVTGSAAFDGSNNITITTSTNHLHSQYLPLSGGTMTGTINFTANQLACNFRPDASGYCTGIMHQTSGDEALMFAAANAVTSFIFKCGQNPVGMTSTTWTGITPSMQIKKQSVYINSLIANNVPPSYNLYVNGTTRCNGTLGVGNGSSAEIDFFPNSSSTIGAKIVAYNDRIEFVFG